MNETVNCPFVFIYNSGVELPNILKYEAGILLCCIVLYCVVLCCIVLYCVVLCCIALYCVVLCCIVLYCVVLCCIA
jgi:hypothetical protein